MSNEIDSLDSINQRSNQKLATDFLLIETLLYLTKQENWNPNFGEDTFFRNILLNIDLTKFGNLTTTQIKNFLHIFQNLSLLKINCICLNEEEILPTLTNLKSMHDLEITLPQNARLPGRNTFSNLTKIVIHAQRDTHDDYINQLLNAAPTLSTFTLCGGHLTIHSLLGLVNPKITAISLINITIAEDLIETMTSLFFRQGIKKLELVTTTNSMYNLAFMNAVNDFLPRLSRVEIPIGIENLTVTLSQCPVALLSNFMLLKSLKKIKILYSVQFSLRKIVYLAQHLRRIPNLEIIFMEYFDPTLLTKKNTETYSELIQIRSIGCKAVIEALGLQVLTYNHRA